MLHHAGGALLNSLLDTSTWSPCSSYTYVTHLAPCTASRMKLGTASDSRAEYAPVIDPGLMNHRPPNSLTCFFFFFVSGEWDGAQFYILMYGCAVSPVFCFFLDIC